jgi:hypothetical protein
MRNPGLFIYVAFAHKAVPGIERLGMNLRVQNDLPVGKPATGAPRRAVRLHAALGITPTGKAVDDNGKAA